MLSLAVLAGPRNASCQEPDQAALIQRIDASVQARIERIAGYIVIEDYAVFRDADQTHPAAMMTVRTTYRKETGKSYEILSESGSGLILRFGLHSLLDNEKSINLPGNRERSWITSANYAMTLEPGLQTIDGRACQSLRISPRRKAPNMIDGRIWVDAADASIVRLEGSASKSPSIWTGPTHMMRQYASQSGFAMATHAHAESDSTLLGRSVVTIDYHDYQIQLAAGR
ncbi:MAG: hypothetical protein WCE75_12400 [Terracidiphilus sp.]